MPDSVFTIGHSVHPIEGFISLLQKHGITAVADVRSSPFSRYNPQFNQDPLKERLKGAGIAYVFLGKELGARSEDRDCYIDGKVQYDLLARTALFESGLERVLEGVSKHRISLMCAEKDPMACHRAILVCRHLVARGLAAKHILEDGRLEPHEESLARLLKELRIPETDLFRSRDDLFAEAYAKRGQQIAYDAADEPALGVQQ